MEAVFDVFKQWVPFLVFFIGLWVFDWRVVNRKEDKIDERFNKALDRPEARFMHALETHREDMNAQNQRLREDINAQYESLKEDMNAQNERLREDMNAQNKSLREDMNAQYESLKESIDRLEAQLHAYFKARQADMDRLIQKIDSNSQDLRAEIRELNQSHIRHLEHHIELDRRAEKK